MGNIHQKVLDMRKNIGSTVQYKPNGSSTSAALPTKGMFSVKQRTILGNISTTRYRKKTNFCFMSCFDCFSKPILIHPGYNVGLPISSTRLATPYYTTRYYLLQMPCKGNTFSVHTKRYTRKVRAETLVCIFCLTQPYP